MSQNKYFLNFNYKAFKVAFYFIYKMKIGITKLPK